VLAVLWDERGRMWFHARATIVESAVGFALASCWAPPSRGPRLLAVLERTLRPWLVASQAIPILAVAPLIAVWLDYGTAQIMVAFIIAFFPVSSRRRRAARGRPPWPDDPQPGAGRRRVFVSVAAPGALPALFSGLKLAAVFSVTGAVVAEYVGPIAASYLSEFSTASPHRPQLRGGRPAGVIGVVLRAVAAAERIALPHRNHSVRPSWRKR